MPERATEPQSDSREPPFMTLQVLPGDLCRSTMYDNPRWMVHWMRDWFGDHPDDVAAAVSWFREVADLLERQSKP
jgi:hypothetical protein